MTRCTNPILSMFLGGMLMLAQACDQSPAGEKIAVRPDLGQNVVKVDVNKGEPAAAPVLDEKPSTGDVAPVLPPPPVGRPGDEIPNNGPGYGGGSQGALEPVRTGDEDEDEDDDFGVCGNGVQEVLRNTNKNCPHLLYGTVTPPVVATVVTRGPSNLVYFNPETGQGFNIATITGIDNVSAIDFSPEGFLYGVGINPNSPFQSLFAQIDCQTGVATIIGPTNIESVPSNGGPSAEITDIDFNSDGQLWAFLTEQDYAGTLNFATGQFTPVSTSPIMGNTEGFGLASFPFPNDQLYSAGDSSVVLINENDGTGMTVASLTFPTLIDPFITGMDNDPLNNILYVAIESDTQNNLGVLNVITGNVSLIGATPVPAPLGFEALAVNHRYEECDTGGAGISEVVITGTACINCDLVETNCADGIDNDFNGLTDCADPACLGQSCNDGDACTLNDTCTEVAVDGCVGTDVVCNDENPCTTDQCCDPDPDSPHFCDFLIPLAQTDFCVFTNDQSKLNVLGSCEEDGRACTVGKCTLPAVTDPPTPNPTFICFETDRKFVAGPLGCLDPNQCTADSCVESWTEEGHTSNGNVNISAVPWGSTDNVDAIGNVILDNDWQCETEAMPQAPCLDPVTCREGACTISGMGMPGSPANIECLPNAPTGCDSNADCDPVEESCIDGTCVARICEFRNVIFVTSTTHDGNFAGTPPFAVDGLVGADAVCQARATAASLPGTYKAWLSETGTSANSRLTHSTLPYALPDGAIVAANYAALINTAVTPLLNPIDVDEFGTAIPPGELVWTGTTASGTSALSNCLNWITGSNLSGGQVGIDSSTGSTWTQRLSPVPNSFCDSVNHLYCLQQ